MKRYIRSSQRTDDVRRYLNQCVRNIANYFYDNQKMDEDDPRADYFVDNICGDWEVEKCKKDLQEAILNARARQLGFYP